jgi:hypothetical protein
MSVSVQIEQGLDQPQLEVPVVQRGGVTVT